MKPLTFLLEVKTELAKVVWPTRAQTIKLTFIVILVTILAGIFIGVLDYGLSSLASYLLAQ